MRFWWLFLAACGTDRVTVPATVVHANVTMTACASQCTSALGLYGLCGPDADRVDADTHSISAVTNTDADKIAGIVEIIYAGTVVVDSDPAKAPYLAYILGAGETADVLAASDGSPLYRIDPQLGVIDLDKTRLAAASGNELRFEYPGTVEQHTVDKARPISVEVSGDPFGCCSTARPSMGALLALAILLLTRTSASRRCRRARRPRR